MLRTLWDKTSGKLTSSIKLVLKRYVSIVLLLACLPLGIISYIAILDSKHNLEFASLESWGSKTHQTLTRIFQIISKNTTVDTKTLETLLKELSTYSCQNSKTEKPITKFIDDIHLYLKNEKKDADRLNILNSIVEVQEQVMNISKIALDPEQETYYLGQIIDKTIEAALVLENIENLAHQSNTLPYKNQELLKAYSKFTTLLEFLKSYLVAINEEKEEKEEEDSTFHQELTSNFNELINFSNTLSTIDTHFSQRLEQAQNHLFKLNELSHKHFDEYMDARLKNESQEEIITLLATIFALAIIFALFITIIRSNKRTMTALNELGNLKNNLEQQVTKRTKDLNAARLEAESASQMKSAFLANMSHELRTPLNGIIGVAELLQATSLTSAQNTMSYTIIDSAKSLQHIINDILDLSKIDAGKMTIESAAFDVLELIQNIFNLYKPQADKKDIALIFLVIDDGGYLSKPMLGDQHRLRQIINNLINNALKFTEHGHITITLNTVGIRTEFTLNISIADSGMGIPKDKLATIYDAFSQGDASTTRRFGGTGLGLSISKRLIELMGGEISCKSTVGKGTTFNITIPTRSAELEKQIHVKYNFDKLKNLHILLVEDNPVNQFVAKSHLENAGCIVTVANHGKEAIELLNNKNVKFNLVIMDCQMPVMDGYEATQALRAQGNRVPIIALTANAMQGDREKCINAGMNDYLSKPFKKEDLLSILIKNIKT